MGDFEHPLPPVFRWLDLVYLTGLAVSSPYWLCSRKARAKVTSAFRERIPPADPLSTPSTAAGGILIHGVSLGEINATRSLVEELRTRRPDLPVVISATTASGFERAHALYATPDRPGLAVARFPIDLSWAVRRFLTRCRPQVVVLMELELWPNFLHVCHQMDIPVIVVNGRLTEHSLRRYRAIGPLSRRMFQRVALLCVQDDTYRQRFIDAGAPRERVVVTGSMKFDTAQLGVNPADFARFCAELDLLPPSGPLWVCGSTGPGEEELCLRVYGELRRRHPTLRLALVPRRPERFTDVAGLIERLTGQPPVRRSTRTPGPRDRVLLGDTLGELRLFYAAADVVFVGRSLLDLGPQQHGSDMLEAAALGKPVLVGPFTGNFADAMRQLRGAQAVLEVGSADALRDELARLLDNPDDALQLGRRAQAAVRAGQGATARHADVILRRVVSPTETSNLPRD